MSRRDPDELTIPPDGRPLDQQPRWRQDFPIDTPQDHYVARREFTKFLVLTSGAFAAGQAWIVAQGVLDEPAAPPAVEIARLDRLPIGGTLEFRYPTPDAPKLLVRLGERELVAFDTRCTHLSCPVVPNVAERRFHCPCHEGLFDLETGRPLAGPPRRPLPRVELELRGDRVYALGVTERTS